MNPLLEQFLVECRELSQKATEELLALEASPRDSSLIDGVFRGFHTLKGAAGIVDFPAMGRVLHEAESTLALVRGGERQASAELIGDCLACLDQVERWLDEIEVKGEVPTSPDAIVAPLIARFARPPDKVEPLPGTMSGQPGGATPDWAQALLDRGSRKTGLACVAFRYEPDSGCFFRGDDPIALVAHVPELLVVDVAARNPWPALEALDSFECNLVITALSGCSPDVVSTALRPVLDQVEIWPLALPTARTRAVLSPDAVAVLEEQSLLVAVEATEGFAGRLGAAAQVAINIVRQAGLTEDTGWLEGAFADSLQAGDGVALADALRSLLSPHESPAAAESSHAGEPDPATEPGDASPRQIIVRTLRVDVDRIDALVSLAGELTVAKNAIGHAVQLAEDGTDHVTLARTLKDRYARLNQLVSELQRSVLEVRVLPLRHVFQHFPRLVREMARDLGKSVRLVLEGETTEADKATVEALFDPILHVIRNAVDHGVEPDSERRAAGKTPSAQIRLRGDRDGDRVIVEISDDGRGIDIAKVRATAARRNLASPDALAAMGDAEAIQLIFSAGFSTATAVTEISGRGVGMDAVRTAVARIGGSVTLASEAGRGTTVRFILPFTIIMVRVMTVRASGQTFGIPIGSIIETAVVPRGQISRIGAAEAVVLRDRTVPLVQLSATLGLSAVRDGEAEPARIVVVSASGQSGALEVEGFGERMDVMLRPMEGLLAGMNGFAGTTLLGDGRVLIVLDPADLLR